MFSYWHRQAVEIEDRLRYDNQVRRALCRWNLSRARGDPVHAIVRLCAAARLTDSEELEKSIQERIVEAVKNLDLSRIDLSKYIPNVRDRRIYRAAILKPYLGPDEKGVVFIAFEIEWARLLSVPDVYEFSNRYTVVVAPSSSPHNLINYVFAEWYADAVFTLVSNARDLEVIPRVSSRLIVVPLYASHWTNPELYQPLPKADRSYDLIMVASWGKVKRHHALFGAMRHMPRDLRVVLVGHDQEGRTVDTTRDLARAYGVEDRLTILGETSFDGVTKLFAQARASVVLSKREGSCLAVPESLFADTPVALLENAVIGSSAFINLQTGCFLDETNLARDLTNFVRMADRFEPRAWAEQNISCLASTQVLNDLLKRHALAVGYSWTQDIAPLQRSPTPTLVRSEDRRRLASERAEITRRFGLEIGWLPEQ